MNKDKRIIKLEKTLKKLFPNARIEIKHYQGPNKVDMKIEIIES